MEKGKFGEKSKSRQQNVTLSFEMDSVIKRIKEGEINSPVERPDHGTCQKKDGDPTSEDDVIPDKYSCPGFILKNG